MFNVGDKVKIVKNNGNHIYDKLVGRTMKVVSVGDEAFVAYPYTLDDSCVGWCEEELELVESAGRPSTDHVVEAADMVNHPVHYTQGSIECIDALKAATVGKRGIEAVCVANVIKYLWRYEEKNGLEDIRKAKWYLSRLEKEVMEKDDIESENHQ